jgi:anthranilate synthase component II
MKVLIIDNFDSFTYNLYQYVGDILQQQQAAQEQQSAQEYSSGRQSPFSIIVERNNALSLAEIDALAPDRIIISPGPGSPDDPTYFGICSQVIEQLGPKIPILGVCLGMQGITTVFGGKVVKATKPMHGKTSRIRHLAKGIFEGIPQDITIMRYHSLIAEAASFPPCLEVTAWVAEETGESEIMGLRHREHPIYGIQYHPESFASEGGRELLANFLCRH